METLEQKAKRLEHFETPEWAVKAILNKESMTQNVIDPCCGTGILSIAAMDKGHTVMPIDIEFWGYKKTLIADWLKFRDAHSCKDSTVLMNPPFSLATDFVEQAFKLGVSKIICFQRLAWYESNTRKEFWEKYKPNKIYVCGDRATCWRHDLSKDEKGNRYNNDGKRLAGSSTAHAWYIWETDNPPTDTISRLIYKDDAK